MNEILTPGRIDYKTAVDREILSSDLDEKTRTEFRAIDIAICAMNMDPAFESELDLDAVLPGVFDLETLFSVVTINCGQDMVDDGHIKNWGRNIMRIAENGYGTGGNEDVNKKLRDFVLSDTHHFGIEIEQK